MANEGSKPLSTVTTQEQLPMWPDHMRGSSNALARSALFNVTNLRDPVRARMDEFVIASQGGIRITYTGTELRQDDHDVFLQLLHVARMHPLGTVCLFRGSQIIQELGWTRNAGSLARLRKCITRLTATALSVTVERASVRQNYTGSLIRSFRWQDETGEELREWNVLLEKNIIALFGENTYTRLNWSEHQKLAPMEKWLHKYYMSHGTPYPVSVAFLHHLSGSKIASEDLRKFRYKLKKALAKMLQAGLFKEARINPYSDHVEVQRYPVDRRDLEAPREPRRVD